MLSEIEMRPHPGPIESDRASRSGRRGVVDRRRSILVGHDFSGPAHRALARAVDVARTHEAKLHILHATPRVTHTVDRLFGNNRAVTHARDSLARVTAEVRAKGLSVRPHMIVGSVPQAVRSTAGELHADLVVVGARGRVLPDALVGSTAERIAAATERPVLMVRRAVNRPYRHLVVAIDAASDLRRLLEAAKIVAPGAQLSLLHAYEDPYETGLLLDGSSHANLRAGRTQVRREARAALMPVLAKAGLEQYEVLLRNGNSRRVLEFEDRERSGRDALFVLERERSVVEHLMSGGVCRWLIARGESDVLLV